MPAASALVQGAPGHLAAPSRAVRRRHRCRHNRVATAAASALDGGDADVVVIGAGLGGLCAAALLASYGKRVTVCESHAVPGGATHSFSRSGFTFESGPSLFSDLNSTPAARSDNPMAQVLSAVGETLAVTQYNSWHVHVPEGSFVTTVGTDQFTECLRMYVDATAAQQWTALVEAMRPLSAAATAVPAAAARTDGFALLTLARFLPKLLGKEAPAAVPFLMRPFSAFVQQRTGVTHPFLLRWLDLLCFLLSGAPSAGTPAAEIGFMFQSWCVAIAPTGILTAAY